MTDFDPRALPPDDDAPRSDAPADPDLPPPVDDVAQPSPLDDDDAAKGVPPRRSAARDRQMWRKQGRASIPPSVPSAPRPTVPARTPFVRPDPSRTGTMRRATTQVRRFQAPEVRLPFDRVWLVVIGGVVLVAAIVFALGRVRNNPVEAGGNALWLGLEWTYEDHDDSALQGLTLRLREHQIGTIYAWVSWVRADRTWDGNANFQRVQGFTRRLKTMYPEARVFAWLGFPTDAGTGYRLDDQALQQQAADFSLRMIQDFGFDGVFLSVEPVASGDENFLALLRRVRQAIGTDTPLGAAVPPDWSPRNADIPLPALYAPGSEWSGDYKQSVALLVDEMAILTFNSGLSSPADYTLWTAYQVRTFAEAIDELGGGTDLVIGVSTYDAAPPVHDPAIESITSAVEGVRLGLQQAGEAAAYVRGLGLYADVTTDEAEWSAFRSAWVSR